MYSTKAGPSYVPLQTAEKMIPFIERAGSNEKLKGLGIVSDSCTVVIVTLHAPWTTYKAGIHLGTPAFVCPPTQPVCCTAIDVTLIDKYKLLRGFSTNLEAEMGMRG